ncbi:MATE family efflux transporter [Porphyromonadaceae bacterium W3.11]|nr:MATE family efflux transporter [Porphyromonadaceae bacterium W3.11]
MGIKDKWRGGSTNIEGELDLSLSHIFQLSWPVMVSLLAQNLIGVIDTAFIARLGEVQLGGVALAGLVYFSIYTIGFGLASGTQIMFSHRYGAKQYSEIGHVIGQSLRILSIAALLVVILAFSTGRLLFGNLISSPDVAQSAIDYWNYRSIGYLFAFIGSAFRSFFISISKTKVLTLNAIVMSIVNIFLDYVLIFGELGFPEMGIKGAAIASVSAEIASLVFYLLYIWKKVDRKKFGISWSIILENDRVLVRALLKLSYYLMMQALLSQSVWTIFFFMIESLGERELAIASIIRSLYILLFLPVNSYGTAVRSTVGHIVGNGQPDKVIPYIWKSVLLSFGTMLLVTTLVQIFPEVPLSIFTDNPELIHDSIGALRVVCIAVLICSIGNMFFTSVGSTGDTKRVFIIELLNIAFYLGYAAIMVYLIEGSVALCFTVEILYYVSIGLMSYHFMASGRWKAIEAR